MTNQYSDQLSTFINEVRGLLPENSRELLLGGSGDKLTSTQGHVLMLLAENDSLTNGELSRLLGVSQAAVTKAMRGLAQATPALVEATVNPEDARVKAWSLTATGSTFAAAHRVRHEETAQVYGDILNEFSHDEQETISRFLSALLDRLKAE